ncbi:hypothetical protein GCM10010319_47210 [Streptomyces blastmyceticus]|uniref:Uncharacterized protein n=1 Tax=Streptomyces blastmyceticus TaxID=68180 RepID=A0ABP3H9F1_9ACTN
MLISSAAEEYADVIGEAEAGATEFSGRGGKGSEILTAAGTEQARELTDRRAAECPVQPYAHPRHLERDRERGGLIQGPRVLASEGL